MQLDLEWNQIGSNIINILFEKLATMNNLKGLLLSLYYGKIGEVGALYLRKKFI